MRYTWTGGRDVTKEGAWTWSDLTPFKYTNWRPSEPNNKDGEEDCFELDGNGKWNDQNCGDTIEFVCKIAHFNGRL